MIQTQITVTERATIAPAWWRLTLEGQPLSASLQPGQFLLVRCDNVQPGHLRRPIFPQPLPNGQLALLLRPDPDPGLAWLSSRRPGDTLDIIGPLGRGFALSAEAHHLLLVSDRPHLASLLGLIEPALAVGVSITVALGSRQASALYPIAGLPPAVEIQTATLDGSAGQRGAVTSLLPNLIRWADQVCAVGSRRLYRAIQQQTAQYRFSPTPGFAYGLLLDLPYACGLGACFSCAVTTKQGVQLACLTGPVVDLAEIDLSGQHND